MKNLTLIALIACFVTTAPALGAGKTERKVSTVAPKASTPRTSVKDKIAALETEQREKNALVVQLTEKLDALESTRIKLVSEVVKYDYMDPRCRIAIDNLKKFHAQEDPTTKICRRYDAIVRLGQINKDLPGLNRMLGAYQARS